MSGINVDAAAPVVTLSCPSGDVLKGATAVASWTAADEVNGSGLAGASSGTVDLATGTVGSQSATVPVGTVTDNVGHASAVASCTYRVVFPFDGFYQPIDGNNVLNVVKAGSAIPVKFSLGGDEGLDIFAAGYPKISPISCQGTATTDALEETSTATTSGLKYDPLKEQYNYTWKTTSALAGTCSS